MDNNGDIIDFFETLVDDSPDPVSEYVLLNQADAEIRQMRPWEILKTLDSTKTRIAGDTADSAKALPTNFDRPHRVFVGENQTSPLRRVSHQSKKSYAFVAGAYFIDYKNGQLYISGGTQLGTIYNHYLYRPLSLAETADASHLDAPVFPSDFWPVYAYKMAEIQMGGIDFDQIASGSLPTWARAYQRLLDAMTNWDASLKDDGDVLRDTGLEQDLPRPDLGLL